jgi:O-antigen ligase
MNWRTRHFLKRRRWDGWALALAGAALPLRNGVAPVLSVVFAVVGIYLVAARHRGARSLAPWFTGLAVAYLAWSLIVSAWHGDPFLGNRQTTYSLLIALLAFIANGLVLVRDPRRFLVIGSRVGVVVAMLAAYAFSFLGEYRVGLGGNPAPFAMVATICMIAAILPIRNAPRWAPNSVLYAVVGAVPVFFSETRALLVVLPIVLIVEYVVWLRSRPGWVQGAGAAAGLFLASTVISVGPVHDQVERVFVPAFLYYTGQDVDWDGTSGDVRLALWQGSVNAISHSPLVGYGEARMPAVVSHAPSMGSLDLYTHVHNMILDEALIHGLPGLALLLTLLVVAVRTSYVDAGDAAGKRNIVYFALAVLSYGALHNPFLHETTICGIFLYLGVMIAVAARNRERARVGLRASAGR